MVICNTPGKLSSLIVPTRPTTATGARLPPPGMLVARPPSERIAKPLGYRAGCARRDGVADNDRLEEALPLAAPRGLVIAAS